MTNVMKIALKQSNNATKNLDRKLVDSLVPCMTIQLLRQGNLENSLINQGRNANANESNIYNFCAYKDYINRRGFGVFCIKFFSWRRYQFGHVGWLVNDCNFI